MKKALLLVTLMMMASGLISGCTLDDVLNLGGDCPNVEYIQMPDNASCSPQNISSTECKRHIEDGAFDAQRCPVGYVCNQNNEKAYCHCEVPCGISCCPQNSQCDLYTHQCIPANQAACSSDAQCSIMDVTLPYCDTKTGQCVACTKDEHCKDEMSCQNNVCIECTHDDQCKDKQICSPEGRCVECLGDEPPACDPNQTNHVMICIQGKLTPKPCPADAPVCSNGECIACQKHEDCQFDGHTGYCIDNQCLECLDDSECLEYYGSQENPKLYCLDNQCSTCQTNAQCSDPTPACNAVLGACTQCSETTPGNKCENNKFTSCDVQKGTLIEKQCDNACDIEKGCVDCTENSDCTRPNKICTPEQKCIECETDDHCADHPQNRPYCNTETGMCYECESDEQCQEKNSPNGDFCLADLKICVECRSNSDCKESDKPTCSAYTCVNLCETDSDCHNGYRCIDKACKEPMPHGQCYDDTDCAHVEGKKSCLTSTNTCVECVEKSDCANNPHGKFCDSQTHTCSGCESDAECSGATPKCNTRTNVCVACLRDGDCSTKACIYYQCVDCKGSESKCNSSQNRQYCQNNKWEIEDCKGKGCTEGSCNSCTPGATQCNGTNLEECTSAGSWKLKQTCDSYGCFTNSRCGECVPNTTSCSGNTLIKCSATGYESSENCPAGCNNNTGQCNTCSNGETKCSSTSVQKTCSNNSWISTSCTFGCSGGSCNTPQYVKITNYGNTSMKEPGADIDAVVVTRNGSQFYADDVISASYCIESPDAALYEPDSFTGYPNTGNCRASSTNWTPYAIMGDSGSTLVLKLSKPMKNGDYLEVLEVGNCALTSGTIAGADTIKVEYGNNSEWQYCNQQTGPSVGCTISF